LDLVFFIARCSTIFVNDVPEDYVTDKGSK
jgi:hypothetical protein